MNELPLDIPLKNFHEANGAKMVQFAGFNMPINYKPGIWHFPLISTEDTNFLVVDRKGKGENLVIHKFEKEKITLKF